MSLESTQSDAMASNDSTVENDLGERSSTEETQAENSAEQPSEQNIGEDSSSNQWEPANLPGTVLAAEQLAANKSTVDGLDSKNPVSQKLDSSAITSAREAELLALIHDLNECNDVLLARVSHLETTLETSHKTLKQARDSAKATQSQMLERANAQQASAQQISQHAQQQVASLVDQLETAQQESARQQLVNETLLAELENAKERVGQLEHECALNAQQQAEEAQSRVKAESTIRDLRSRLQRQQRYTLQFKAALEKSLTVTARSTHTAVDSLETQHTIHAAVQPISSVSAHDSRSIAASTSTGHHTASSAMSGVTMPRAQRIVPWAAQSTAPFEGIDPHLESLIRGASQTQADPTAGRVVEQEISAKVSDDHTVDNTVLEADIEAETQLWQDLERVVEHSEVAKSEVAKSEVDKKDAKEEGSKEEDAQTVQQNRVELSDANKLETDELETNEANERLLDVAVEGLVETSADDANETDDVSDVSIEDSVISDVISPVIAKEETSPKFNWQSSKFDDASNPGRAEATVLAANLSESDEEATSIEENASLQADTISLEDASSSDAVDDAQVRSNIPSIVIDPYTVPEGQTPAAEVDFTEPSPWGKPVEAREDNTCEGHNADEVKAAGDGATEANACEEDVDSLVLPASILDSIQHPAVQLAAHDVPFVEGDPSAVAPVVNPLRSQKKLNSMASVQLPTFEKAKVSSFQR